MSVKYNEHLSHHQPSLTQKETWKFKVTHLFNLNTKPKLFSATHAQKPHSCPPNAESPLKLVNTSEM